MTDPREPEAAETEDLERRLDSLFASMAPRARFEADLRAKLGRPGVLRRWRATLDGLGAARLVPIMAAVLVVGLAGFAYLHTPGGGGATPSAGSPAKSASAGGAGGSALAPAPPAGGQAFGSLPAPAGAGRAAVPSYRPGGSLSVSPAAAPVYRYAEPSAADAARFAASLGASRSGPAPAGSLGTYAGPGFEVTVYGSDAARGLPPRYAIRGTPRAPFKPGLPDAVAGRLVDGSGAPVANSFPLTLSASDYPIVPPPSSGAPGGAARLAYVAVPDGPAGYLEPVYVVTGASGTVTALVPAVSPALLRPRG